MRSQKIMQHLALRPARVVCLGVSYFSVAATESSETFIFAQSQLQDNAERLSVKLTVRYQLWIMWISMPFQIWKELVSWYAFVSPLFTLLHLASAASISNSMTSLLTNAMFKMLAVGLEIVVKTDEVDGHWDLVFAINLAWYLSVAVASRIDTAKSQTFFNQSWIPRSTMFVDVIIDVIGYYVIFSNLLVYALTCA